MCLQRVFAGRESVLDNASVYMPLLYCLCVRCREEGVTREWAMAQRQREREEGSYERLTGGEETMTPLMKDVKWSYENSNFGIK